MNRAYRGTGSAASWNTDADFITGDRTTADLLRQELRSNPEALFLKLVEAPGVAPLGCVLVKPEAQGTWYLGSLAADPDRQGSGLGRELLLGAEEWVRRQGGTRQYRRDSSNGALSIGSSINNAPVLVGFLYQLRIVP